MFFYPDSLSFYVQKYYFNNEMERHEAVKVQDEKAGLDLLLLLYMLNYYKIAGSIIKCKYKSSTAMFSCRSTLKCSVARAGGQCLC